MPRILFVSGFHPTTRARDLAFEFEKFGPLIRCDVPAPRNPHAGHNPYAFVEFRSTRDAEDAYYDMHGKHFEGYRLSIQWAKNPPSSVWRYDRRSPPPATSYRRRSRSRSPRRRDDREKERDRDRDRDRERDRDRDKDRDRDRERRRSRSPERERERERERRRTPSPAPDRDRDRRDREREGVRDRERDRERERPRTPLPRDDGLNGKKDDSDWERKDRAQTPPYD